MQSDYKSRKDRHSKLTLFPIGSKITDTGFKLFTTIFIAFK